MSVSSLTRPIVDLIFRLQVEQVNGDGQLTLALLSLCFLSGTQILLKCSFFSSYVMCRYSSEPFQKQSFNLCLTTTVSKQVVLITCTVAGVNLDLI